MINHKLIPFKQIGQFKLDRSILNYKNELFEEGEFDDLGCKPYYLADDLTLFVDKTENIEFVICYSNCVYKGINMIGMAIQNFIEFTNEKYSGEVDELDFEEDNIPQYIYEFESIGLQIWVKEGIIVTVIVASISHYEED